jgi:hypothetical protein
MKTGTTHCGWQPSLSFGVIQGRRGSWSILQAISQGRLNLDMHARGSSLRLNYEIAHKHVGFPLLLKTAGRVLSIQMGDDRMVPAQEELT